MTQIRASQTTAQDLIETSLRLLNELARGESASSDERNDALEFLNDLLESWNLQYHLIFETSRESFALTANQNPHTIGLDFNSSGAGDFDIVRPPAIKSASTIPSGATMELPVSLLDQDQWNEITDKTTASAYPTKLWYERDWPLGRIWLYPKPTEAATLILYLWQQLESGMALGDRFSVPPGYLRALRFNLAVELASEFGKQIPEHVGRIAMESKMALGMINVTGDAALETAPATMPMSQS